MRLRLCLACACVVAAAALLVFTKDYAILYTPRVVLRDGTATVTATGTGMEKQLLVNGGNDAFAGYDRNDGASDAGVPCGSSKERAGHLLWHGDNSSVGGFLGYSQHCGRTCSQRAKIVSLLSSRRAKNLGLATFAGSCRRRTPVPGAFDSNV